MIDKAKQIINEYISLESSLFRYSLSYCLLLALLPGVLVLTLLFQYSILDSDALFAFIYRFVPDSLMTPFITYVMKKEIHSLLTLIASILIPCFVASKAIYSFLLINARKESFHSYHILLRIKSFFLFFYLLAGVLSITFLLQMFHVSMLSFFSVGLFLLLWLFYRMLSFYKQSFLYGMIGALISSCGIHIVGIVFYTLLSLFTSYETMYGPLASLVVLFLVAYIISCIIYFGYCINIVFLNKESKILKDQWFYVLGESIILKYVMIGKKVRSIYESKNRKDGN